MRKRIDDDCNDGVGGNYNDGVGVGMRRHKRRVKGSVCSFPRTENKQHNGEKNKQSWSEVGQSTNSLEGFFPFNLSADPHRSH